MNAERLVYLRRTALANKDGVAEWDLSLLPWDVLQLLDEREALLDALKDAAEALGRKPTGDPQEYLAAVARVEVPHYLAVIAKAEAE